MPSCARIPVVLGAIVAVLLSAASVSAQRMEDLDESTRATLEQIRAATEKYQDPEVALAV